MRFKNLDLNLLVALDTLLSAIVSSMPVQAREQLLRTFESHSEVARTVMLHARDNLVAAQTWLLPSWI